MAATVEIRSFHGATPDSGTNVASGSIRFKAADNDTVDANNPLAIPAAGTIYSYLKQLRFYAATTPSNTINNLKFYTDTANGFGTGVGLGAKTFVMFTGSSQNDFLGPQRASVLTPTGSDTGTFNQWTASTGTRTGCVDESPTPNDDTDYISDNTAGHQQSFTMTDLPVTPNAINGLSLHGRWRRDDAGPHTARLFLRNSGGTIQNEATESIAATYETKVYQRGLSPFSSGAWTKAEIDGLQAGVELVS